MKKMTLVSLISCLFMIVSMSCLEAQNEVTVSKEASKISWTGYKILGKHTGSINVDSGTLKFEDKKLVGGEFVLDMTSIVCSDLDEETGKKLVGHLSSDDFFGVENFPTSKLIIKKAVFYGKQEAGDEAYKIIADLTIKDVTKEIKFTANVINNEASRLVARAGIEIDRTDFDIKYGSGTFMDDLGDKTIYDEFKLNVILVGEE